MSMVLALVANLLAAAGAIGDVLMRRLPNVLCLALAIVCAAWSFVGLGASGLGSAALHALVALLVGMGLFKLEMAGAGDAKFYTALAFGVPLSDAFAMVLWMSLGGLAMLVVMAMHRRMTGERSERAGQWSVPYGVAIYCGFIGACWPRLAG